MAHYHMTTPLSEDDIVQLHIGDTVMLSGHMFGIRDANLIRIFDHGIDPPADLIPQLMGSAGIHTAPNVIKKADGSYGKMCIGTTTSTRMDRFTPGLMQRFGMRAIIGKGGQYELGTRAIQEYKGVYLSIVGGAAALETTQVEEIESVWWEDLMPECIWKFRIKNLGPLFVTIDCHGGSVYSDVKNQARLKLSEIYKIL